MLLAVGPGVPVSAQRYPPFPIDGTNNGGTNATGSNTTGSNTTGGGNNNTANGGAGSEFFNPGAGGSGSAGSGASNTSDDGPSCDLAQCLRFAGEVGGRFVAARVEELGDMRVAAVAGCCEANSRIDVFIESERRFLGTVYASEDGSYFGQFTIPAAIKPGMHHIVADIEGCGEFRGALEVLARGSGAGDGGGTSGLGSTVRNSAAGDGGILPRTGGELFRLAMWALILIGLGTLLILGTKRLTELLAPAGVLARRSRSRHTMAALPPAEVPFVDTSRFVPYRSGLEERTIERSSSTGATRESRRTPRAVGSAWTRPPKNESLS
jgi:hypothetical protein